jgi:hypothetical protein
MFTNQIVKHSSPPASHQQHTQHTQHRSTGPLQPRAYVLHSLQQRSLPSSGPRRHLISHLTSLSPAITSAHLSVSLASHTQRRHRHIILLVIVFGSSRASFLNVQMQVKIWFLLSFFWSLVSASVLLPRLHSTSLAPLNGRSYLHSGSSDRSGESHKHRSNRGSVAMAIPGYSVGEQVIIGGMLNFLQLYNFIITARVLLSWFPQAQVCMVSTLSRTNQQIHY